MLRYKLRTLLIGLVLGPVLSAACWWLVATGTGRQFLPLAAIIAIAAVATWISFAPERRFWRDVARRDTLNDEEFFRQFYGECEVPRELVLRLLPKYSREFGFDPGKLRPLDRPPALIELDTGDFIVEIEREFGLKIPDQDAEQLDGSFDSIVRYLAARMHEHPSQTQ
jgi:hypothetical protein